LFLALRDAEAAKVRYDALNGINVDRSFVYLSKDVAKMRERTIHYDPATCPDPRLQGFIPGNLKAILAELPPRREGLLAPSRRRVDLFKTYARHCGIRWEHNGLRAGFASHHYAYFGDAEKTSKMMGHLAADGGLDVFYKFYLKYADYEAGKAYFAIGAAGLKAASEAYKAPLSLAEFLAITKRNKDKARGEAKRVGSRV
jgi:hypothetical protein